MSESPYEGLPVSEWPTRTKELIDAYPLGADEIVSIVLSAWDAIFDSRIGGRGFGIGKEIFPKPQIMAFLLHELIPLEFSARYPDQWRGGHKGDEKDLVCMSDQRFSLEIKASSHPTGIFGNRSYAQRPSDPRKSKNGYYLAVNFGKFEHPPQRPRIQRVRFGWLDHTDWVGQKAPTGQQARLGADSARCKLLLVFEAQNG